MKLKKKTKKRLRSTGIGLMILAVLLPMFSGFLPKEQATTEVDPKLAEAYWESLKDDPEPEPIPNIEGNYELIKVLDATSLTAMWGDVEEKVELIGVEAMESSSKGDLENLLTEPYVSLEFDAMKRDEDGTLQAYAYLSDGTFINQTLLAEGKVKLAEEQKNTKYIEDLSSAQEAAMEKKAGYWAEDTDGADEK